MLAIELGTGPGLGALMAQSDDALLPISIDIHAARQ